MTMEHLQPPPSSWQAISRLARHEAVPPKLPPARAASAEGDTAPIGGHTKHLTLNVRGHFAPVASKTPCPNHAPGAASNLIAAPVHGLTRDLAANRWTFADLPISIFALED